MSGANVQFCEEEPDDKPALVVAVDQPRDRAVDYHFPAEQDVELELSINDHRMTEDDNASNISSQRSADIHRHLKRRFSHVSALQFSFKNRLQRIVNFSAVFGVDKIISDCYQALTVIMVALSTALFVITSMPAYYEPTIDPDMGHWWFAIEVVMVGFFTLDFVIRLSVITSKSDLNLYLVIDFLSFVGFYIELGLALNDSAAGSGAVGLALLRLLRIARILRLFKLGRQDSGLAMLWQVLMKSKDGLFLLVVLVGIAIMVFASITYYIEIVTCTFDDATMQWIRNDGTVTPFQSIPDSFWFIAATVTTVGYGDQFPGNLGGRAWTVLVMLFGVLVLSFPNILIGSNFSEVHRQLHRERARSQLGKYFRKVRTVVRFVRMWREFRVKGHLLFADVSGHHRRPSADGGSIAMPAPSIGGLAESHVARRMNFFMFRISDFADRGLLDCATKAVRGALDHITYRGVTLLVVMQRLVECFSGCATVEELTHSFHFFLPPEVNKAPAIDDVFELILRGGAAQILNVFVLHREDESALVYPTKRGIEMMLNFREGGGCPCLRGYAEAREIWYTTTRAHPYEILPLDGYRAWQSVEGRVPKRSPLDFCYDLKHNEAQINDIFRGLQVPAASKRPGHDSKCNCRHCNHHWGIAAPMRPSRDYCFEPDEEFLEMEIEYAKNTLIILKLETKLANLLRTQSARRKPRSPFGVPVSPRTPGAIMESDGDDDDQVFEETMKFSFAQPPPSSGLHIVKVPSSGVSKEQDPGVTMEQGQSPCPAHPPNGGIASTGKANSADSDNSGGDITDQVYTRESSV
jgi:hypothetical protein